MRSARAPTMMLFGGAKKMTLKEQTRKWRRDLRKECEASTWQIRQSNMQEKKIQREIKKYAKRGERASLTILAKDLISGRRQRDRLHTAKAQLNSVSMQLQEQMCMAKVAGALQQSTGVMQAMSKVVRMPAVAEACQAMAREMSKAGIIQEMQEDMFEMLEPDMEEERGGGEQSRFDISKALPEAEKTHSTADVHQRRTRAATVEDDAGISDRGAASCAGRTNGRCILMNTVFVFD